MTVDSYELDPSAVGEDVGADAFVEIRKGVDVSEAVFGVICERRYDHPSFPEVEADPEFIAGIKRGIETSRYALDRF